MSKKKYVIESAFENVSVQKIMQLGLDANGRITNWTDSIENVEELNSDYINEHFGELQDEAYKRGYDDGYEAGCATAFKPVSDAEYQRGYDEGYKKCLSENDFDQPCVSCEDYQRGLDDAMSAFKKLYSCGWERDWKAMGFEFDEGEWSTSFEYIIGHYTAAEIVEKVKAYEDKHSDRIEVGDEVNWLGDCFIVTRIFQPRNMKEQCDGIDADGSVYHDILMEDLKKTGKHYDIQSILEAMRE